MSTIWVFDGIKIKHDVCKCNDCVKKFCKSLENHAIGIINFEKKKMISLPGKNCKSYERQKISYIKNEEAHANKYCKVTDHCHYRGNKEVLKIVYVT